MTKKGPDDKDSSHDSDDKARKIGYYVEKLSELERYLKKEDEKGEMNKLTEVHKRLISKEMDREDVFNNLYEVSASTQEERFVEIVMKYRPDLDESVIRNCL